MSIGKHLRRNVRRMTQDARFRDTSLFALLASLRNPAYAAKRRDEIRFYEDLLGPDRSGVILDLGASSGSKAQLFRHHGHVICVEPSPVAADRLRERFGRCADVDILEAAVSDTAGQGTLLEFEPGSAFNTLSDRWADLLRDESRNRFGTSMPMPEERAVPLVTIDQLVERYGQPRYIKIDVEGSEWPAIRGMTRACPLVSAEFNLPEFRDELALVARRLEALGTHVTFNAAIEEPPARFEFADWLDASTVLDRIQAAGWRYVELFCRTTHAADTSGAGHGMPA